MRRFLVFLLAVVFAVSTVGVMAANAQEAAKEKKKAAAAKEQRVSGTILRSSKDQSSLTVRTRQNVERIVVYDSSTKWTKGEKREAADMADFKDGSRVIALGKWDDKSRLAATEINLRAPR